jgi:hypothetical protein
MTEYALLIDSTFKEIRQYAEQPADIPHKQVTWHDVVREYGTPFEGLENGNWVIRTVDPATLPPPVPSSITPRQCRLILSAQGMLADVETTIAGMDEATQITWEYALEFRRDDPLLNALGANMGLTSEQIDEFFIAAAQL